MDRMIIEILIKKWNPHFDGPQKGGWRGTVKRAQYLDRLERLAALRHIVILTGVRRSGKSTLMRQLMGRLVDKKVNPRNLLYLYFEDVQVQKFIPLGADLLEEFYNFYREKYNPEGRIYVFLDELQGVKDFNRWLHTHYEFDRQVKFIVSGSRRYLIEGEAATLLTGRNVRLEVYPFNFAEYLAARGETAGKGVDPRQVWEANFRRQTKLLHYLHRFLNEGGYPEIVLAPTKEDRAALAAGYYQDILVRDVIRPHQIRATGEIEILGLQVLADFTKTHTYRSLGRPQELSVNTVKTYLNYFYQAYLFFETSHFSYKIKETQDIKRPKKIYVADNGLRNFNVPLVRPDLGQCAENLAYNVLAQANAAVYYYQGKKEVDFVALNPKPVLYNVSYTDEPRERETAGMLEALIGFKLKRGTVLTKNLLKTEKISGKTVEFVPLWAWLLAQGGKNG